MVSREQEDRGVRRKREILHRGKPVPGSREAQIHWMASSSTPSGGTSVRRVSCAIVRAACLRVPMATSGSGEDRPSGRDGPAIDQDS